MGRVSAILIVVVVGLVLGVAIAGVPSRHQDPPLRVVAAGATTTTGPPAPAPRPTTTSTTPPHNPGDVTVLVVNAANLAGRGGELTAKVRQAGYATSPTITDSTDRPTTSVVEYAPGYLGDAVAVGTLVGIGPVAAVAETPVPSRLMGSANVMVVLGADLH